MNLLEICKIENCPCGKSHQIEIKEILIEENAINKVPDLVRKYNLYGINGKILLIYDENTFKIAGTHFREKLRNNQIESIIPKKKGDLVLIPDESAINYAESFIKDSIGLLIAIGSGVISDITRFLAFKHKRPFLIFATAPSMDGYASSVCALHLNGTKITINAKAPDAIIADINIFSNAPSCMIAAGFADLLGKITCSMDWYLASRLKQEYICENTRDLVLNTVRKCLNLIKDSKSGNKEFVVELMKGLIMSGLAISMIGNSRPASGAEHHISHFLELKAIHTKHIKHYLHGETVALGTYLMHLTYSTFFNMKLDDIRRMTDEKHEIDSIEMQNIRLRKVFSFMNEKELENILKNYHSRLLQTQQKAKLVEDLVQNWNNLKQEWNSLSITLQDFQMLSNKLNIPFFPKQFDYDKQIIEDAYICAKELRDRYTIFVLLDELGLLEHFCSKIMECLFIYL